MIKGNWEKQILRNSSILIKTKLDSILKRLVTLFPDFITGDQEVMRRKLRARYGEKECSTYILEEKKNTMKLYLIITVFFLLILLGSVPQYLQESEVVKRIKKPAPGEASVTVPVKVTLEYNGIETIKSMDLNIRERALSPEEKQQVLGEFVKELPNKVLGENLDINHISKPLNLIDYDDKTGISILWSSSHPEVINEKGEVDLIEAGGKTTVILSAQLTLDHLVEETTILVIVNPDGNEEYNGDYILSMEMHLKEAIEKLLQPNTAMYVELPGSLPKGMNVIWQQRKEESIGFIVILYGIVLLILYGKRYAKIDKEIKASKESISRDLPEFINKLVLLLNAGLVFSYAFAKIVYDYEKYCLRSEKGKNAKRKYLYSELLEIQKRVEKTNTSLIYELKDFAQRSGVRDLMRITAIISENWNKGSSLAEKMEMEGELMWIDRKKRTEERGRLAETKLTFPLMILLIILILITIAPALMEM